MTCVSQFLTDDQQHPLRCWHGTCSKFDYFHPLSHFAVDKRVSESYEFTHNVRPVLEYYGENSEEDQMRERVFKTCRMLTSDQKTYSSLEEIKSPHYLIPVWLKIKHPIHFSFGWFDFLGHATGTIYAFLHHNDQINLCSQSIPEADFIFKNPFELSMNQVKSELKLDTLFQPTQNDLLDRSHLAKQRFIQFWENYGFDSILYDCAPSTVFEKDSTAQRKLPNFDPRSYVIFRPSQVYRLDRPELNHRVSQETSLLNKKRLGEIQKNYIKNYHPYAVGVSQQLSRIEAMDCFYGR